jgi:hypothetical protein
MISFQNLSVALLEAVGLFFGMLLLLEAGRQLGLRRQKKDTDGARAGLGAVEGAIFGLLGLLVAFTFSGAAARFDARRQLTIQEANNIGTAWLRLDLLPADAQPALRGHFRSYLDSRIETYRLFSDPAAAAKELAVSLRLQGAIWKEAVAASARPEAGRADTLLLPALNEMFDIVTTRTMASRTHPPPIVFWMLGTLVLSGALFAGFGMAGGRTRSWVHYLGYAGIMALTVLVTLDLEYPRLGMIRVDAADQALVEVRAGMK